MKCLLCFTLPALVLAASPALAEKPKLVVMPLQSSGLDAAAVATLDELLSNAVRRLEQHRVIGKSDIDAMLGLENMKDQMGCDNVTCAAEIGGALGADLLLAGRVAKLGDNVIIVLKLIDAPRQNVVSSVQHKAPNNENVYDKAVDEAVLMLFGLKAAPTRASGTGVLQVTAKPTGATLRVDGREVGVAPVSVPQVSAGEAHTLRAELTGHWPVERVLTVVDGETKLVELTLMPRLQVTSNPPSATVFVNDRSLGATPIAGADLMPGKHVMRVQAEGYWPEEQTIGVEEGTTTNLAIELQPRVARWMLGLTAGGAFPVLGEVDRGPAATGSGMLQLGRTFDSGLVVFGKLFFRTQAFNGPDGSGSGSTNIEVSQTGIGIGAGYVLGRRLRLIPSLAVEALTAGLMRDGDFERDWAAGELGLPGNVGEKQLRFAVSPAVDLTWAFTRNFYAGLSAQVFVVLYRGATIGSFAPALVIGGAFGD